MLSMFITLLLIPAPAGRPAKVATGAAVRLFDTAASAQACTDAMAADLAGELDAALEAAKAKRAQPAAQAGTAAEVCDAGTVVKLAPATLVRVGKTSGKLVAVAVEGGKNAGRRGWLWASQIENR